MRGVVSPLISSRRGFYLPEHAVTGVLLSRPSRVKRLGISTKFSSTTSDHEVSSS